MAQVSESETEGFIYQEKFRNISKNKINILVDRINVRKSDNCEAGILDSGCSTTTLRCKDGINDFSVDKSSYFVLGDCKRYKSSGRGRFGYISRVNYSPLMQFDLFSHSD